MAILEAHFRVTACVTAVDRSTTRSGADICAPAVNPKGPLQTCLRVYEAGYASAIGQKPPDGGRRVTGQDARRGAGGSTELSGHVHLLDALDKEQG